MLADKLQVNAGDLVNIKILDEHRPEISVYVADIFQTYIGMPAYMNIRSLNKKMEEDKKIDLLNLRIDDNSEPILLAQLKEMPGISAVSLRKASLTKFSETIEEMLVIYVTLFSGFACALAFGLVYNSTRITLSERGRELATLRVLGFSKAEISYILLGEVALLTIISLPVGCVLGYGLSLLIVESFETELYRMAIMIKPSTYGTAAMITLSAAALSAFLVRRRIDRLNLIHVLKTRE
jgi:putative ABC transport system permease protein